MVIPVSPKSFIVMIGAVLLAFAGLAVAAPEDDGYQVIILDGTSLPGALGNDISDLSLAAVRDGLMEPVPFQIDEYNEGGAVYFDRWEVPLAGTRQIFDEEDKLLFLLKDAGSKRRHEPYDGEFLAEIRVKDPAAEGSYRYAYLVRGSRLRSEEQYVRYSDELGRVETDFYELVFDKDNHLIWKRFDIFSYEGNQPFDTMKIRLGAGFMTSLANVELNNKNVIAQSGGVRVGPIRTTTQLEMTVWMFEIPLFTASLQLHHYPKSLIYDLRLIMPEFRRALVVNPTASVSLDGNRLMGARLMTAAGPEDGVIVDGKMTEREQAMLEAGLSPEKNWLYTHTGKNLDVIAFIDFLGEDVQPLSLVLTDDAEVEDKPERFRGQLPNFGIRIDDMPKSGLFGFVVSLFVDDSFKGPPAKFSKALRTLPEIRVVTIQQ
ncbi:MAG: hypothetical protein R3208_05590 [Ketobacteraceae bacterium]|nr:hypothetical protein [Ketobacteraceae bacterium]